MLNWVLYFNERHLKDVIESDCQILRPVKQYDIKRTPLQEQDTDQRDNIRRQKSQHRDIRPNFHPFCRQQQRLEFLLCVFHIYFIFLRKQKSIEVHRKLDSRMRGNDKL